MSTYDEDNRSNNQLTQYINHLLIQMHESQRDLIKARFLGQEESWRLRAHLQSDIVALYWTLRPYRSRAGNKWKSIRLYGNGEKEVNGMDKIANWSWITEEYEIEREDFSKSKEKKVQAKVLSKQKLVMAATALAEIADLIGFHAVSPDDTETDDEPF